MATGVVNTGEELLQKLAAQKVSISSMSVGLFNDSTDSISDANDIGDITTEPSGGSYAQQSFSLPGDVTLIENASTNVQWDVADQTFDISDSTQTVDSWFVVASFTSDVINSESGDNTHLIAVGGLSQSYDLSSVAFSELKVQDVGWDAD